MEVYLVEISTDFYGVPDEVRVFGDARVADAYVTWANENHSLKDRRYFNAVGPIKLVVEDSF